jgi:hypothetical protein
MALEQEFGREITTLPSAWAGQFRLEESGQIVIMHIQRMQLSGDISSLVSEERTIK